MMPHDNIEGLIKGSFRALNENQQKPSIGCPPDEELADYIYGIMNSCKTKGETAAHVIECDLCFSKVASSLSALTTFDKDAISRDSLKIIQQAKTIPKTLQDTKTKKGFIRSNRYLFITVGFFILSFIFKRYFMQFLAASLVFGFKWVMDAGSSRALIMIYNAWRHKTKDEDAGKEKRPIFKNRQV